VVTPAPPAPLTGPTDVNVTVVAGPDCTTDTGDTDVRLSWTSDNADGVWTLTQDGYLVINDPRTGGGRHIARLGVTDFLFDCSQPEQDYIFRSYNATDYGTDLIPVENNLG
jgi:hypothetical protein